MQRILFCTFFSYFLTFCILLLFSDHTYAYGYSVADYTYLPTYKRCDLNKKFWKMMRVIHNSKHKEKHTGKGKNWMETLIFLFDPWLIFSYYVHFSKDLCKSCFCLIVFLIRDNIKALMWYCLFILRYFFFEKFD